MKEDFINKIIQGDCLEVMKEMPDNSVDLVLTDPPYIFADYSAGNKGFDEPKKNIDFIKSISKGFDINVFLKQVKRICKKFNLIIFCSKYQIPEIMRYGFEQKLQTNLLIWKKGGRPFGITYLHDIEYIIHIRETGSSFNGAYKSKIIESTSKRNYGHATEKPIKIIEILLTYGSNKNDLILDPFLGSGTVGVAAIRLKRNYIGIEISPEYCKIARQRIASQTPPLF